jgi:hypothetical protein
MKRELGLWIDHKKAVIFSLSDSGAEIKRISAGLDQSVQVAGKEEKDSAEVHRDSRFSSRLNSFYEEVITYIRTAESILIFGPGEAKGDLKKKLEHEKLHENIVGFETADIMTDNQIVTKIRQRFLKY